MKVDNRRIPQLDGLRVVAIILIFLSHMDFVYTGDISYPYGEFFRVYLRNSDLGVDYFFMLSGFGLYLASLRKEPVKPSLKNCFTFAWRKIRKFYPFYLASMLMMIPFQPGFITDGRFHASALRPLIIRLPFMLTLTQSLVGVKSFSRQLNSVSWFLSTLFLLYMVTPVLLPFLKKKAGSLRKTVRLLSLTLAGLFVASFAFLYIHRFGLFGKKTTFDLFYGSPYIRVFYLAVGMEIGMLYSFLSERLKFSAAAEWAVSVTALLYYLGRNLIPDVPLLPAMIIRVCDVTVCMLVLGVFALGKGRVSSFLARGAGASEYITYIFLFHYPLRFYVDKLFTSFGIYFGDLTGIAEILVIFGLTLLLSAACVRLQRLTRSRRIPDQTPSGSSPGTSG